MEMLYQLRCLGFVEIGDDIWFANLYFNALVRLNRRTGKIEDLRKFPGYGMEWHWLYATVCHVDEYLVFVPFRSKEIVSYNMQTREFTSASLNLDMTGKKERYFADAFEYGKYVYMFPVEAECIVRYDVQRNSVKYLFPGLDTISDILPETAERFALQFEFVDGKVYMPFAGFPAVAIFDPEKESLTVKYLPVKGGCSTINYHNGFFYMASWKTCNIYRWNHKTEEIMVYDEFPQNFLPGEYPFLSGWVMENRIFFLPVEGNMIVSLDMESGQLYEEKKIDNRYKEVWRVFYGKRMGESLHIGIADKDHFCVVDYRDGKTVIKPYFRQDTCFNRAMINIFFLENGYLDVFAEQDKKKDDYMAIIMHSPKKNKDRGKDNFGRLIWESL